MISVKKDFNSPPAKLVNSRRDELIKDAIINKNKHEFKSSVYRQTTIEALEVLFNHKCAYCESDTSAGAPFQVEHFRPKAKVEGATNHNGYYWLAYEWSNLTLGCSRCNNAKKNHFPINGTRISQPQIDAATGLPTAQYLNVDSAEFLNEQSILLNPEVDTVENHIYFLPNGRIEGLDERGVKTIELLKLNRTRLVFWRKKVLDDFLNEIRDVLEDLAAQKIGTDEGRYAIKQILKRVASRQHPSQPYSRFGYFIFNKFEIFIGNQLDTKQKDAMLKFFKLFMDGEL
ncbi:MAG: HNH endonuclease [Spirosomaceae bacterium]|jgi:uncharacterized protein (TIGR02646 family)|nr:HNH endonuclease [Spirosomataceae bacterium]